MENNYLDYLMANYPLESEYSESDNLILSGGANINTETDFPTGGFPPIYFCTKEEEKPIITDTKKRELSTPKSTVSIRDILAKRKKVIPFV